MTRHAKQSQCPACGKKWALQSAWARVLRGDSYGPPQYIAVCQECDYIPSLGRYTDGSKPKQKVSP